MSAQERLRLIIAGAGLEIIAPEDLADEILDLHAHELAEKIRDDLTGECSPCGSEELPHYRCGCSCCENALFRRTADLIDPEVE